MTADDLAGWREAFRGQQEPGSGDCPDDDALVELIAGDPAPERRLRVGDHVTACRRCSDRLRDLFDLHAAADRAEEGGTGRSGRWRRGWWLAAAAVVVGAVTATVVRIDGVPDPDRPVYRGAVDGITAAEPRDGVTLDAPPSRLSWESEPGADATHRVLLYDEELTLLWESPLQADTDVAIPGSVRERLERGRTYYWWIVTIVGVDRRQSDLRRFTLTP